MSLKHTIILLTIVISIFAIPCIYGCYIAFIDSNDSILTSLEISLINPEKYDSIFSPVTALFAVIGAIFSSITLIKQFESSRMQKRESILNNFNNQINLMTSMRTDIVNTVIFDENPESSNVNYEKYKIGKTAFSAVIDKIITKDIGNKHFVKLNILCNHDSGVKIMQTLVNEGEGKCAEEIIEEMDKKISKMTHGTLNPFFHNVYTTLKIIYENEDLNQNEKNNYFRMIRSHFSQPELLVIYYHALIYKDFGERKFKKLIEDTCFFHSIIPEEIPVKINEDKYPELGYKLSAFYHPDEIKKLKETQEGNNT